MKDVVEDEVLKEIDTQVMKCYYNICKYFNKNLDIINKYLIKKKT